MQEKLKLWRLRIGKGGARKGDAHQVPQNLKDLTTNDLSSLYPNTSQECEKEVERAERKPHLPHYSRLGDVPSGEEGFGFEIGEDGRRHWL